MSKKLVVSFNSSPNLSRCTLSSKRTHLRRQIMHITRAVSMKRAIKVTSKVTKVSIKMSNQSNPIEIPMFLGFLMAFKREIMHLVTRFSRISIMHQALQITLIYRVHATAL